MIIVAFGAVILALMLAALFHAAPHQMLLLVCWGGLALWLWSAMKLEGDRIYARMIAIVAMTGVIALLWQI